MEIALDALKISVLGMVTVFVFLILLIGSMNLSAVFFRRWDKGEIPLPGSPSFSNKLAAISAAVRQYEDEFLKTKT